VSVAMSIVSRNIGMACLLALNRDRDVAISAALGAAVGLPLLLLLVPIASAPGAAFAVAVSESVVTVVQAVFLWRALQNRTLHEHPRSGNANALPHV
jgi:O-antigen/teichoic acid export membrane protein